MSAHAVSEADLRLLAYPPVSPYEGHLEQAFLWVWFPDASATWSHYQGAQTRSDAASATTGEGETMDIGKIVREIVIEPIEQPVREPAQPARPAEPEPAPEREPVTP
jgi:hypothetical protein